MLGLELFLLAGVRELFEIDRRERMAQSYIDPEWLEIVRGKQFYYPCGGEDWHEPLRVFSNYIDEFWFCDLNYPLGMQQKNFPPPEGWRYCSWSIFGNPFSELRYGSRRPPCGPPTY
jgi:hypothetical protein